MADVEAPPAEFATASTRIIVARHAERADDVDVGWTAHDDGFPDDPPLTPFGLEQAALLAQTLLKARPNLDVVCTSMPQLTRISQPRTWQPRIWQPRIWQPRMQP